MSKRNPERERRLRDVLRRIPDIPTSRIAELLPDRWQAIRATAASPAAQGSDGHRG